MFWTCCEQKKFFWPQGGPLYRFFSKKLKFPKILKNMFFCIPGPKKVFFRGFKLLLTVKNWEKLEKIEFSDSLNLTVFEVQTERSEGNHLIYSFFKTSLDHDLDAQRPQKPTFNWFWNQQKSRLSYFLRLFFISEPVHVKLDVA